MALARRAIEAGTWREPFSVRDGDRDADDVGAERGAVRGSRSTAAAGR